jgi:predicted ATPase with chaperone activity
MVAKMKLEELMAEPHTIEELQIPQNLVIDILLRLLYNEGNVNFRRMSQVTRVPTVLDEILEWLRKEHLVEISQASSGAGRLNYVYKLTQAGEERAQAAMERSQYVGPFPVPVHYYNWAIELQTQVSRRISQSQIKESLNDLVLPVDFHRRIGPAVNSGASLFLYGPSGNGKTTIAQKIAGLITGTDPIWLPYALTAGGQIIQIHDRLFHTPVRQDTNKSSDQNIDGRWNLFNRPSVVVGGELKMEALDLRLDTHAKIYEAPLQLKANSGMFLIDDFGRQQVSPADLLNRWIVPLENGVDYLRLHTGQTIVVPFRTLIVFSTNLDPYKLADDAFYRRIQMKVGIFSPNQQRFRAIFQRVCAQMALPFNEASFVHLVQVWYQKPGRVFQSVHPRDLLKIVVALCEYLGCTPSLTPDLIDEACATYFVEERYSAS